LLCNIAKVLQEDPETGSREYRYRKLGEDHYRHALNYFYLASIKVGIAESPEDYKIRRIREITEARGRDWKPLTWGLSDGGGYDPLAF